MGYKKLTAEIEGVAPLLMHNARLADPDDEIAVQMKEISVKKKKTSEDRKALADLQWEGGLYLDDRLRPFIPSQALDKMLVESARLSREGKDFERGCFCDDALLLYDGPTDVYKLRDDPRFRDRRPMTVDRKKVMRTRPRFNTWGAQIVVQFHTEVIENRAKVVEILKRAGEFIGLFDGRPRCGRFVVKGVKDVN